MPSQKIDSTPATRYINNQSVINLMNHPTAPCQPPSELVSRHARRKEARPGELLEAALDLFVEKGFAATKAEEVARRAGVSKGTLFLYFSSKEELFKAVVRKNIAGRFAEWNAEFDTFDGNTPDLLRYAMTMWWLRLGSTKASGITKLMLSEAHNFPELAAFYQHEVIQPAHVLLRRILQRGVDRSEFAPIDMKYGVYTVLAPMLFLQLMMHSKNACIEPYDASAVDPQKYIAAQLQTILAGLCVRPAPTSLSEKLPAA